MKKPIVLASTLSLALSAVLLAGCDGKTAATVDPPKAKTEAELLAMGARLAAIGDCAACHSPIRPVKQADGSEPVMPDFQNAMFGGGNAWLTPGAGIGVSINLTRGGNYMKNATVETLVEKWSDKSKTFLPPMPPIGQVYSEEELTALATYFLKSDTIPEIAEEAPSSYIFATKNDGDTTWPIPGVAATRLRAAGNTGDIIPGGYEISVSPLTDGQLSQAMINANIAAAKAPAQ